MSAPAGYTRLGVVGYSQKGEYDPTATYNQYNTVTYQGNTYYCKVNGTTATLPTNTSYWGIVAEVPVATTTTPGKVKPDGTTVTVDNDGTIHAAASGHSIVDSTGITVPIEPNLQFVGAVLTDDDVNNRTVVSFPIFRGATASIAGIAGRVPVPSAGEQDKFLKGDGTWDEVKSSASYVAGYINSSATPLSSTWLNDENGSSITPEEGRFYTIMTSGDYYNFIYRWNATNNIYEAVSGGAASGGSILEIETSEADFIGKTVTATVDGNTYTGVIASNGRCNIAISEAGTVTVSVTANGTTYSVPVSAPYFSNYNVILAKGEVVTVELSVDDDAAFTTTTVTVVDETDSTKSQTVTMGATRQMFVVTAGHDYHIEYGEVGAYTAPAATDTVTAGSASHAEYRGTYRYSMEQISIALTTDDSLDVSSLQVTLHNVTDGTTETKTCSGGRTSFSILNGKTYFIQGQFADQHTRPKTDTYTAVKGVVRNVTLQYLASQALGACSWATIKAKIQAGTYSSIWQIGDTKTFELTTGEEVEMVIADFNHDTITGGSTKAPITFTFTHSLATGNPMNETNTNVGGWKNSYMRGTVMPLILSQLPSELRAMVIAVDKKSDNGSTAYTIQTTSDSMFLFSEEEFFGAITYGKTGQGTQYPYFATVANRVSKMGIGGSASSAWERSSRASDATTFCLVRTTGSANSGSAAYAYGVRPGFCISA